MLKRIARTDFLKKRMELEVQDLQEKSEAIFRQFSLHPWPGCEWLLSYYPLTDRKEFDVAPCEKALLTSHTRARLAWPRIDAEKLTMEALAVDPGGMYAKNRYNILEPISGDFVDPAQIDIIFVPLVIFDTRGYRVGYGKGYYDRFLLRCRPDALKVGFCFFEAIPAIRDIDEFDVPLNLCITPSRVYEF